MKKYSTLLVLVTALVATPTWARLDAGGAGARSAAAATRTAGQTATQSNKPQNSPDAQALADAGEQAANDNTNKVAAAAPAITTGHWSRVFTLSLGPDSVSRGQPDNVILSPTLTNRYTRQPGRRADMDLGLFFGGERTLTQKLSGQIGLAGYIDSTMTMNGYVWTNASITQINSSYSYNIRNRRLVGAGKLLYAITNDLHPYISAEMGIAFNRATNYSEVIIAPNATIQPPFSSHPTNSFTWGVGVGIEYLLNDQIRLGGGYQFTNFGSATLGGNPTQTTSQAPSIKNLYANQVRFQFSYLW